MVNVNVPEVFQGEYQKRKVAIKSLKDQSHDLQKFLAEASVMTLVMNYVSHLFMVCYK